MSSARRPLAVIFGTPGTELSADQRAFFRDADPLGLILFKRNCVGPDQLRRLCAQFREAVGRADAPILVDHEGGEHQRLDPPVWPSFPSPAAFGRAYARDAAQGLEAARLGGLGIGQVLAAHGISVDCAPLLDVPVAGADPVIGERAFASDPETVALLGGAFVDGLLAAGVAPVVKHIPGHGRAAVDSHKARPVVDTPLDVLDGTDFLPFCRLADSPWAMVAHVVYAAVDPERPATTSAAVIDQVIRQRIGYPGVLVSDCIWMDSLVGTLAERCRDVLAAGMDVALASHGDVDTWADIAAQARPLTEEAWARLEAAKVPAPAEPGDLADTLARLDALLGG